MAVVALTVVALATGCGGGGGESAGGSSGAGDPIKLGAWFPLTGAQAASGIPQEVGASVFWQHLNDDGGVDGTEVESSSDIETGIVPPLSFGADDHLGTDAVVRVEVQDGQYVAMGDFVRPGNAG